MNIDDFDKKVAELAYMKSESFEFLAHDINNIFNNVRSSTDLCRIFLDNTSQIEKVYEQLDLISGQISRGIKLISNVRKLTQFNKFNTSTQPIKLLESLNTAIKYVEKNFRDKKVNIKVKSPDKKISIDANKLIVDIFENILINAVLHNLNYSVEVSVEITQLLKDNLNYVKIQFMDNGIGISDDRKKWILESSFVKDKHGKGMGFGLSLAKEIINSYDGSIWVEDRIKGDYSKGSNFVVLFPLGSDI
ncbi:MAG: sensor histidine kinase [Promethearchaeota archaeon]